eukprot:gene8170-16791_t
MSSQDAEVVSAETIIPTGITTDNISNQQNFINYAVLQIDPEAHIDLVRKQVEYYFSRENLQNDSFLTSQMDSQNSVPIATVMQFAKLKALTEDEELIKKALETSKTVSIVDNKIKSNVKIGGRNTIILRDIPSDTPEDEILAVFKYDDCKPIVSVRSDIENTWFVVFESEQDAKDVILDLKLKKRQFRGESVKARLKSETITRSFYMIPPPQVSAAFPAMGFSPFLPSAGMFPGYVNQSSVMMNGAVMNPHPAMMIVPGVENAGSGSGRSPSSNSHNRLGGHINSIGHSSSDEGVVDVDGSSQTMVMDGDRNIATATAVSPSSSLSASTQGNGPVSSQTTGVTSSASSTHTTTASTAGNKSDKKGTGSTSTSTPSSPYGNRSSGGGSANTAGSSAPRDIRDRDRKVVDEIFDHFAASRMGIDRVGQVCVMIHSGSRGLGHQVATDSLTSMESAMARDNLVINDRQLACARINSKGVQILGQRLQEVLQHKINHAEESESGKQKKFERSNTLSHIHESSEGLSSASFYGMKELFLRTVEVTMMLDCLWLALWATNYITLANIVDKGIFPVIILLPLFCAIVKPFAKLLAITSINHGAFVAKAFIELHNGNISVSSQGLGFGCTFTIDIPTRHDMPTIQSQAHGHNHGNGNGNGQGYLHHLSISNSSMSRVSDDPHGSPIPTAGTGNGNGTGTGSRQESHIFNGLFMNKVSEDSHGSFPILARGSRQGSFSLPNTIHGNNNNTTTTINREVPSFRVSDKGNTIRAASRLNSISNHNQNDKMGQSLLNVFKDKNHVQHRIEVDIEVQPATIDIKRRI